MKKLLVLIILFCFVFSVSAQSFHPINSDKSIEVNLIHPNEQDIKLIVGNSTNYEIKWIDENNYNLTWEENGVIQNLATFGALTIPGDAVYFSSTPGCEVIYAPQESYNRANNLTNIHNYQYYLGIKSASGGWSGMYNRKDPAVLCSYGFYNMSDSCSIKSQWITQCLNKTSSFCNSKDSWGPWQILCPSINSLYKYNTKFYYDFSRNAEGYCYVYSVSSNQDEYLGQCTNSCSYGICDGGNQCTGVNCGAHAYCSTGSCYCNSGYGNCNGSFSDGCESNLNSDNYNCGSCGHACSANQQCVSGSCVTQDPCAGVNCNNYCSGENRFFNGYCSTGSCIGYNSENCNAFDGYTCNGNTKEYRDYYCAPNSCNYSVSTSINCDSLDNYGSLEYYCSGNDRRQHRKFYDYSCSSNDCSLISSNYIDDSLTESCQLECLGSPPNAYCNNGCSGQLNITVQDKQGTLLQNASVYVNNTLKGTTDSQGKFSVPTLSSSCGEIFSVKVVSFKGTNCGTKTTIINTNSDNDFVYFACQDPLPKIQLDAVPGTFIYVLNEIINFSVTAFNASSELLSNVGIGVIDPLKDISFFNVIPSFPWNYSSTANSTGSKEFKFSAFKSGFEPDYKKVNLTIESLPSIKVSVQDSQENSIENAKVYLDENFTGETDSAGEKFVSATKGTHEIKVENIAGELCDSRNVSFGGQTTALFNCCNSGNQCQDTNTLIFRQPNCLLTQETKCDYGCDTNECRQKFEPSKGIWDCSGYSGTDYNGMLPAGEFTTQNSFCTILLEYSVTTIVIMTTFMIFLATLQTTTPTTYTYYAIPKYDGSFKRLDYHYNTHKHEFGTPYITIEEYVNKCKNVLNSQTNQKYYQPKSSKYQEGYAAYDPIQKIYSVGDTVGKIITCFKPEEEQEYINKKIKKGELKKIPVEIVPYDGGK